MATRRGGFVDAMPLSPLVEMLLTDGDQAPLQPHYMFSRLSRHQREEPVHVIERRLCRRRDLQGNHIEGMLDHG